MGQAANKWISDNTSSNRFGAAMPIVVVGNGPVGMRAVKEILERMPNRPIVIYGEEHHKPYNRIRLSAWLAGEIDQQGLSESADFGVESHVEERLGYRIEKIDRENKLVIDNTGEVLEYDKLILATGSSPFVPGIPGIDADGVFTFRNIDDTSKLLARRARSHHTVVLGGGLLGLEAARGMQPGNTRVTVVEHADRLLGAQLDEGASNQLQDIVEQLNMDVVIGDGVAEIINNGRVQGIRLRSGRQIECDTVVVATGIRPNIELAADSKLAFGRGVQVNDQMRTSDPDIYAVGECAEHRGSVYGLVGPGLEQAAVAAADIAQVSHKYSGSISATRLKVVGTQVFSMGPMGAGQDQSYGSYHVYKDPEAGIYRKILVQRHRIKGVIGIGEWQEVTRLQSVISTEKKITPWQIFRFLRTGNLWPEEESQGVAAWPASAIVCQCNGVTRGAIGEAITQGALCSEAVSKATGASTVCGSCKPLVEDLLGNSEPAKPVPGSTGLIVSGAVALLASLMFLFGPNIDYPSSVQTPLQWDVLWRDTLLKQITGFTILGLFVVGLLVSLRKRIKALGNWGSFSSWRWLHIGLGITVIATLIAHTGFRTGTGLNFLLMISFVGTLLLGGISTGILANEHRITGAIAHRLRKNSVLWHTLLFWPVPALLGWHVFKSYWF